MYICTYHKVMYYNILHQYALGAKYFKRNLISVKLASI